MMYPGSEKENNDSAFSREIPLDCVFIRNIGGLKTS